MTLRFILNVVCAKAGHLTVCGLIVLAFGFAGCSLIVGPLPPDAERFTPPSVYSRWWAMTETCSKSRGELGVIQWYRVPGSHFIRDGELIDGYSNRYGNRIVLAEAKFEDGAVVRHEILHMLLREGGHSRSQFLGNCASLVRCQGICVKDAGSWRAPQNYVILPPESLTVSSSAKLLPLESDGQRWVSLTVTVRNRQPVAIVVAAPGDPTTPETFGYDLRGPSGGISGNEIASDSSSLFFQPSETKTWLFEFRVSSVLNEHEVSVGNYLMRGGYARRWSPYETIAVAP